MRATLSERPVVLESDRVRVAVDPGRGADILSIVDLPSGVDVMLTTPWRDRADAIREGRVRTTSSSSHALWLEQYRGGWQTLCPNAGGARTQEGAPYEFHGEASAATWQVDSLDGSAVCMTVELFTAPVRIRRELRLDEGTLTQHDRITNLSDRDISIDYVGHPAFGAGLLSGGAMITTDARFFVPDGADAPSGGVPAASHAWPWLEIGAAPRDLRIVGPSPDGQRLFGWLHGFESGRVSIVGRRGLAVDLEWDARVLPYAWLWQESEASHEFPWFGRTRLLAVEPASTPTSGIGRSRTLDIPRRSDVDLSIALTLRAVDDRSLPDTEPPYEEIP